MSTKVKAIVGGLLSMAVIGVGLYQAFKWGVMREFVAPDEVMIVTNRFGDPLPGDRRTVKADENFKGVREEVYGPGRYFIDPVRFETARAPLVVISAGDPGKWEWDEMGNMKDPKAAPQVGVVTLLEGKTAPDDAAVVDEGFKGVQKRVLTPGTYKLNPVRYKVEEFPATVVPPGSVGVVTRLVGDVTGEVESRPIAGGEGPSTRSMPLVVGPNRRGILRDVLQPGIYYLNPRAVRVTVVPIGYDAITTRNDATGSQAARIDARELARGGAPGAKGINRAISFFTNDGYEVEADFTVVWGRTPADAPELVRNIGNIDKVSEIVIEPAMKAAAQNEGGRYSAKDLIQGTTRTKFQQELTASLEAQVEPRNIQVLIALVRNITIRDKATGRDATQGLLATIQQANIEVERELTNQQKTITAAKKAEYEQVLKQIDVVKETVTGETQVKVANLTADGQKSAAQIAAQTEVEVARILAEVAMLEAQRTQILGRAEAEVQRLKNDAEAQGARMLVEALGSPSAYNQYIFAKNFQPTDLRLIFAGQGTFWTDLRSFQEVGAARTMGATTQPSR